MHSNRRTFIRLATAGTMGGLLSLAVGKDGRRQGIILGTSVPPRLKEDDLTMLRNVGVEAVSIWTTIEDNNLDSMLSMKRRLEAVGIDIYNIGIIDLHCDPTIVLGLPGVETKIEQYKTYLGNLSRAGIHYTTYAHMANIKVQKIPGYYQTAQVPLRGSMTREFDLEVAKKLPFSHGRVYNEEEIWRSFTTFIRAVMPVAEKVKVRIGLHPDDPPVDSLGGVARVFRNAAGFERAIEIAGSENFGLCLCIGTWAEGGQTMGKNPVEMIRYFGPKGRLFKIHFRNVDQPLPKFREMFVDNGYLDMYQVMRALKDVNFRGLIIPDHVPGGGNPQVNYSYTLGYIKALRDRVEAEVRKA